jgi:uncharacterized membrane protein YhhN
VTPASWDSLWRFVVPLAVAAGLAVVDWLAVWAAGPAGRRIERIAKPGVMVALIAAAGLAAPVTPEARAAQPWLIAGLGASLAGDVLLLPPGRFMAGLAAFLLAHLAYLVAFLQLPGETAWLAAGVLVALVTVATVGRILVRAAARVGLGLPVAAYLVAICAMAVAATRTGGAVAIAGAWLFVASDALLGWGRLREPRPGLERGGGRVLGTAVMVTYHAGQALIVLAVVGFGIAEAVSGAT